MVDDPIGQGVPAELAEPSRGVRARIADWGTTGWQLVGLLLAVALTYTALVAFSGLIVPLLLAAVIGTLGVPVVDAMRRHGVPRPAGALVLIAALLATLIGAFALLVAGVVDETAEIRSAVASGVSTIDDWVGGGDLVDDPGARYDTVIDQGRPLLTGAASWATSVFSSAVAFAIGAFLALFMLYYILVDWVTVRGWVADHLGVPRRLGEAIIDDATAVVRRGFGALTLTSAVTAGIIGVTMVALGLPLAAAVTAVTFVTSYVPYLGAILSGAFAFLVALGSGNTRDAIIVLVVVLVAQNVIQTVVGNRLTSTKLSLHPLPSIIASVCGVAVAGLLGAMLSAPAFALAIAVRRRLRDPEMLAVPPEVVGFTADVDDPQPSRSEG